MRKTDIKITTPQKSIIYAIGSRTETNSRVWGDPSNWNSQPYTPGYVLEITDTGSAVVLVASFHPDSYQAKQYEQAPVLDALDYTVEDFHKHRAVLVEYSHWPLSPEQAEARNEALSKLKMPPKGWRVYTARTADVRMLWAEYAERLTAKLTDEKARAAKEKADREATIAEKRVVIETLIECGIGLGTDNDEKEIDYQANRYGDRLELSYKTVQKLLDGYTAPVSETEVAR